MLAPIVLVLVAAAAIVRVPADEVWPDQVRDAASLVEVRVRDGAPGGGVTGTYLTARRVRRPTALAWLRAQFPGGATATDQSPESIGGFGPLDSALLAGANVSPGRGHADELGLAATLRDGHTPVADPAIALYVADTVSSMDLARNRRVLVLGMLGKGFFLRCPEDGLASYRATKPAPDLVIIGKGCAAVESLRRAGANVAEVQAIYDAIILLAQAA